MWVRIELLSFDYAQINLAIQPRRIDISPLYIHQRSTQRCHNSRRNINTRRDQKNCAAGNQSIRQTAVAAERERVLEGEGDHDRSGFVSLLQCSVTT